MRHLLLALYLVLIFKTSSSQNLVPNPSFEVYIQCPFDESQIQFATPWYSCNTLTPDYFNSCSTSPFSSSPLNFRGFQYPNNGNAYAEIGCYGHNLNDTSYREYIQVKLLNSLKKTHHYNFIMYCSLAESVSSDLTAITELGVYFSDTALVINNPFTINVIPQVTSNSGVYLSDTANWMKIEGTFLANGGEEYLTIGNFKDDSITDTLALMPPSLNSQSYYYIDDVSLICMDCDSIFEQGDSIYLSFPNIFTPNNDNVNDVFVATSKNISSYNCKIFNRYGVEVKELTEKNEFWDGHNKSGEALNPGVYFFIATATGKDEKEYKLKGFVTLLR